MIEQTKLMELRRQLEEEQEEIRKLMDMPGQEKLADDLDNADQGDLAQQYSTLESASIVRNRLEDRLNAIDAALSRIEQGAYGRCERCGKEIPIERLKLEPSTVFCVEHAE